MKERGKRDAMAKPFSQAEFAGLFSCNLHKTIFQPPVKTGFYEVSFRGQLVHRFRHSLLDCRCFKLQRLASLREYRRYLVEIFHHLGRERERDMPEEFSERHKEGANRLWIFSATRTDDRN